MIRWQAALDGASGFSQNTGLPAAIAATTCSSWAGPQDATSTASTLPSAIRSWAVAMGNRARQARRDLPGARRVDVVDGRDGPAGEHLGDPADVVLADHPHSDDADADAHGYSSSPMPRPRR